MGGASGGVINNVRLVKCPKCNRVLPELTDVPVYRCGGCGVLLQAKNHKKKIEEAGSVPSEAPSVHTAELENIQDDNESATPQQNGNDVPPKGDNRDQSNCFQKKYSANYFAEAEIEQGSVSNEVSVDNEVLVSDDENLEKNEQQDSICHFKGPNKDEVHIERARKLSVGTTNPPPSVSSSLVKETCYGPDHHTIDSPSYLSVFDSEKLPFDGKNNITVEYQPEEEVQVSQKKIIHQNGTSNESAGVEADELLIKRKRRPIVTTGNTHFKNASLPADGVYGGPKPVNEILSTFSGPVSEELQSFGAKSSSPNEEDDSAYGSSYSDVIQPLPIKNAEHSQTSSPSVNYSVNRANKLEGTAALVPISSELSNTFGKISKSATARSGYAYEGSISSYEDQYDQIHKEIFRDVNYPENVGKINFSENQVSNIKAMQQQAQEFFSEKNHKTTQESSWNPMESDELMSHQIRNQMGFKSEIYPSRAPFTNRVSENDGFSSDCWDGMRTDSSIYSAGKLPYTENKRVELLKMIHELQEELSKSPAGNRNVDRRNISQFENIIQFSKERQISDHHRRREFQDEAYLRSNYSRYPFTQSEQGTNWPRPQNHSWVPFSGEVRNHRHHDEYYCKHRQPMDQHFSAQLASSVCSVCSLNAGLQRVHLHPGDQFNNPYSSSTSSPRRPVDTDFPSRIHDLTYNDQGLMDRYVEASLANSSITTDYLSNHEMKTIHARESQLRIKRQIRPTAGGAPFITCYQCWSMLQLPSDSFLFKRRFHKLKCGSCSMILKFSLDERTHLVPYVQDYRAPLPGEVKCRSPEINMTSNVNMNSHSHGKQMSCSDNGFSNSFGRSFSTTEGKQESLAAPTHAAPAHDAGGRKTSSGGSSNILEGKKRRFSKPFFSKDKRPVRSPETSSANRTFNIEDYSLDSKASNSKPRTGSPLHKLMGYTSISQVFRGPSKGTSESFRNKSTR